MTQKIKELLEAKNYPELRSVLADQNCTDIASYFTEIPGKDEIILFRLLPKETAAEIFSYMEPDIQESLIKAFSDVELREVISELYLDDAVDIIEEMPASVVTRMLANSDEETRKTINELLKYPEHSAGSIMTTEYVSFTADCTVEKAFQELRRVSIDKETIYTCYVTDRRQLIGVITVKDMLLAELNASVGSIMEKNVISVSAYSDKEEVARMFDKYDFLALPVVDNENRIVGIVTVDDAIDVIRSEDSEDFEVMAAMTPTDKSYLRSSVFEIVLKRVPWLFLLMISATFTGGIITSFEKSLGVLPILTAYIPMLMDTGGNAGGQASATIVRGLALGEIRGRDIFKIVWKEIRVAVICGMLLSVANFGKIMLFDRMILGNTEISVSVALAVCLTLAVTVIIAKVVGSTLPLGAKRLGLDPAVMASPFITTIVDALALIAYFRISVALISCL